MVLFPPSRIFGGAAEKGAAFTSHSALVIVFLEVYWSMDRHVVSPLIGTVVTLSVLRWGPLTLSLFWNPLFTVSSPFSPVSVQDHSLHPPV